MSWLDNGGDVSWRFSRREADGHTRHVRAGVRERVRERLVRATRRIVAGDWTDALIVYAAAAAELAPAEATYAWVDADNFTAVHQLVDAHRRADAPLVEDAFVRL